VTGVQTCALPISLGADTIASLGNTQAEDLTNLIITTVHPGGDKITGNLLAPLVIDAKTRRGVQLTLDDSRYNLRQEINYFKFGLAVQTESGETPVLETGCVDRLCGTDSHSQDISAVESNIPEPVGV